MTPMAASTPSKIRRAAIKRERFERCAAVLLVLVMSGVAVVLNLPVTSDLVWPGFETQFRELAAAQTLLDEGYGPDSTYRDAKLWYNPLSGAMIAATSRTLDVPARVVVPRIGVYVNLLAPLCFFLMVALLVDKWAAVAGTAAFLFLGSPRFEDFEAATYSGWLLPNSFAQALAYLSIIVSARAGAVSSARAWSVLFGSLLGLTFLGHTAPALMLGLMLVGLIGCEALRTHAWSDSAIRLGIALGTAFLVSLPFVWPIVADYQLRTINPGPALAPYHRLDGNELMALVRDLGTLPVIVGLAGWVAFVRTRAHQWNTRVLLAWAGAVLTCLAYNYIRLAARKLGIALPSVVPAFHFLFYFHACLWIGFGMALALAGQWVRHRLDGRERSGPIVAGLVTVTLTGVVVLTYFPSYLSRDQFLPRRAEAMMFHSALSVPTWAWIREHTKSSDVFLSTDDMSLFVVAPAGRKVVATNRYFSSPYLDWSRRSRDRDRMFELLAGGHRREFESLARQYDVSYVIVNDHPPPEIVRAAGMRAPGAGRAQVAAARLALVFEHERVAVFRVRSDRQ
jgi:hypothetical protein